ncbi:MAG: VWA domain-containing protein [Sandaracinaceae bacterium]|nr:VWA domain-containing protein [Sandaracinaceae bacterium]
MSARAAVVMLLACACGSKSPLLVPAPASDAQVPDAGVEPDGGPPADLCVELPFLEPPREVRVDFVAQILSADVLFLVDVTGSMGEEIGQIRGLLRDEIVPGLGAQIPDLQLAVAHFADFPRPEHNYGEIDDDLYRMLQSSTRNVASVQAAVDRLPLQGGRDGPEALVEALYLTATGEAFPPYVLQRACPDGTAGYPCFRPTGTRIVLAFSDAPTHNGPGGHDAYRPGTISPPPHTFSDTVTALNAIGAKVLGLYSGGDGGLGRLDLEQLAMATGAVRGNGTPLVFDISRDGSFLASGVIEAVRTLVDEVPLDVDVVIEDVPGDPFDASSFVREVVAVEAIPASGAVRRSDRFDDVLPGTRVVFAIRLANDAIPQADAAQSFFLTVVLRGDRVTRLEETLVRIVVPPAGGGVVCPR